MGKYYYAHYSDDINLKEEFIDYCFKKFPPFLRNSESKELTERLQRVEDDPEYWINKFVKENLPRLHLFIDKHYKAYSDKNFSPFMSFLYDNKIPFSEEHSFIQCQYLTDNYRTFYLNFLKSARIIQCDNRYIPQNSTLYADAKSLGYRLHPRLYSSDFNFRKKRIRVKEVILENYLNPKFKEPKTKTLPEYLEKIREMTSNIKFEHNRFYHENKYNEEFNSLVQQQLTFYQKCDSKYFKRDYHIGRRINTPVTNLNATLRKYLYFDNPNENLSLVEVSNCYHYCFSTYLLNYMIPEHISDDLKDIIIDTSNYLRKNSDNILSNTGFTRFLRKNSTGLSSSAEEMLSWETVDEFLSYADFEKLVAIMNDQELKEYILFVLLALSGRLYDVMMKFDTKKNTNRKDFKKRFNMLFNFKNEVHWGMAEFGKNYFPKVHKDLRGLRKQSHRNYYHQMTQMESNLMIDTVSKKLIENGFKFANLHDGIICKAEDSEFIKNLVVETSQQLYEYPAPVRIETIREERKNNYLKQLSVA